MVEFLFLVYTSLILRQGGFKEFETVLQTRDTIEDLHVNFQEFSQPPKCVRLCKMEKVLLLFV